MRASAVKYSVLSLSLSLASLIFLILPYHALLTVWAGSNFGHYTTFRLWVEYVALLAGLGAIWLIIFDNKVRLNTIKHKLSWLIVAYVIVDIASGLYAFSRHHVSTKALAYGLLDDIRFLAFFVICWVLALRTDRFVKRWYKLAIYPAVVVVLFGVLQMFVLPANFLVHFGYGPHTIRPFETINHNTHYIRILSTLRGANPLGTYLILPLSALAVLLLKYPKSWNWTKLILALGIVIVLVGSYSRAAWIGAILALIVVALSVVHKQQLVLYRRQLLIAASVLVIVALSAIVGLSSSAYLDNLVFHSQAHSRSPISSDQAHLSALSSGLNDMIKHPLGEGAGTSGPASVYNHKRPALIPENYYLEVGDESGWLGASLFLAINAGLGYLLWRRRDHPLALTLLAAFIGISFTNLFSLAWTDDTIAFIWWGLAGVALALPRSELKVPVESPALSSAD